MNRLMLSILFFTASVAQAGLGFEEHTLGANKLVSNKIVRKSLDEPLAQRILETPYTAFYQVDGEVRDNKIFLNKLKSKSSYPDESLAQIALGVASWIEFPSYSTGSRIKPRASAYIALFKDVLSDLEVEDVIGVPTSLDADPNTLVVVMVKRKDNSKATNSNIRDANAEFGLRDGSDVYLFELAM
tara:strand:- start:5320 stop:5877 length:558 start_codon:yes stop_codon:yes gene_type:complete